MQEMPKDVKELQDLVEFLNYDREILMNENKRLKALVENNTWEKKYYEVLAKLESNDPTPPESNTINKKEKNPIKKPKEIPQNTRRIRVSLKSNAAQALLSPKSPSTTLTKAKSGYIQSKLDVTISKAYNTLITYENNRSTSKKRMTSADASLNSSRFGTPKRSRRKL